MLTLAPRSRLSLHAFLALSVLGLMGQSFAQKDVKSGVRPNVISLPEGPGSVEGLGESFEVMPNTGMGSYTVPLKVPPGRQDMHPNLALVYNAGSGNSETGLGWSLGIPSIKRQTDKGLPEYDADDRFITHTGEELVRVGYTGAYEDYRLKVESTFSRYQFERTTNRWRELDEFGRIHVYGDGESRTETTGGNGLKTYAWGLSSSTDANGNRIVYEYVRDRSRCYLDEIRYTLHGESDRYAPHVIRFTYDTRNRPDPVIDYRPTFRLETTWRLSAIEAFTSSHLVRRYELKYLDRDVSLIESITQVGSDGTSALPPATFEYTSSLIAGLPLQKVQGLEQASLLLQGASPGNNPNAAEVIDFNGDGLPDLYESADGSPFSQDVVYFNRGGGFVRTLLEPSAASDRPIQSPSSFVFDVNGDGLSDLVAAEGGSPEDLVVKLNEDGAWRKSSIPVSRPGNVDIDTLFRGPDTRIADLNFDKRPDSIRSWRTFDITGEGVVFTAYMNAGNGRFDQISQTSSGVISGLQQTFSEANGQLLLSDINGDRIADLVQLNDETAGSLRWWPGMGWGLFDDATGGYALPLAGGPNLGGELSRIRQLDLEDVNGDGFSDLYLVEGSSFRYWLSAGGQGFGAEQSVSLSGVFDRGSSTYRLLDIDGDGMKDLLIYSVQNLPGNDNPAGFSVIRLVSQPIDDGSQELAEPCGSPNLLCKANNGIGITVRISYGSHIEDMLLDAASTPWATEVPFPVSVVRTMQVDTGFQTMTTNYSYHDGYYDGEEKEFRGFGATQKRELGDTGTPTLVTSLTYYTGHDGPEALKGKLKGTLLAEGENGELTFSEETSFWETETLLLGTESRGHDVTYPFVSRVTKEVAEKNVGPPVWLETRNEYTFNSDSALAPDSLGVIQRIVVTELGRLDGNWDDERRTEILYTGAFFDDPAAQSWLPRRVVEKTVTDEFAEKKVSHERYYYDGLSLGKFISGNLTTQEAWVEGDRFLKQSRSNYDEFGNVSTSYDPLYGQESGHTTEYQYDILTKTYPVLESLFTGTAIAKLEYRAQYDARFGVVASSADFSGNQTEYVYDAFGRLKTVVKPGDSAAFPTVTYQYALGVPHGSARINWVDVYSREGPGEGTTDSRNFYDGLARLIMTRSEGESTSEVVVSNATEYDVRGNEHRRYLPYFDVGGLAFSPIPASTPPNVETVRDGLGRPLRVSQPDGSYLQNYYSPLELAVMDEEQTRLGSPHRGSSYRYVYDGLDDARRLRQVEQFVKLDDIGNATTTIQEWQTAYNYDLLGRMTNLQDAQGNQRFISYDGVGRKLNENDPNRGMRAFEYDDAGNLRVQTDARGTQIRFAYDGLNRLISEEYAPKSGPEVVYTYDVAPAPVSLGAYWDGVSDEQIRESWLRGATTSTQDLNGDGTVNVADMVFYRKNPGTLPGTWQSTRLPQNTLGRLVNVRDETGAEDFSYDPRGRVSWNKKTITALGLSGSFVNEYSYDSQDRLRQLVYPDRSAITMQYNSRGFPSATPGFVENATYNASGHLTQIRFTNGTSVDYGFDNRQRLIRLTAEGNGGNLLDYGYAYDSVSNIISIRDQRSPTELSGIASALAVDAEQNLSDSHAYTYDSLYRLTGGQVGSSTRSYRYDRIGNMLSLQAAPMTTALEDRTGTYFYGGTGGAWNRVGRAVGVPAGPQAVTKAGATTIAYDANGNATRLGDYELSWDQLDRLVSRSNPNESQRFAFDFDSRRVAQVGGVVPTEITLQPNEHSMVRDGQLVKFVRFGALQVGILNGAVVDGFLPDKEFWIMDHLGSVALTASASGELLTLNSYLPYGEVRYKHLASGGALQRLFDYLGNERDPDGDFYSLGRRTLWSGAGVFLSIDPLLGANERPQSRPGAAAVGVGHSYRYANNSPVVMRDTNGEHAALAVLAGAAQVIDASAKVALTRMNNDSMDRLTAVSSEYEAIIARSEHRVSSLIERIVALPSASERERLDTASWTNVVATEIALKREMREWQQIALDAVNSRSDVQGKIEAAKSQNSEMLVDLGTGLVVGRITQLLLKAVPSGIRKEIEAELDAFEVGETINNYLDDIESSSDSQSTERLP